MKILFSDYDGTIKTFENTPTIIENINFRMNVNAINKFIKEGNCFNITTGRTTESIIKETKKYGIDYNYLTSYDGRITIDKDNKIVFAKYLDKELLKELKKIVENIDLVKKYDFYNESNINYETENTVMLSLHMFNRSETKKRLEELKQKYPRLEIRYEMFWGIAHAMIKWNKKEGAKELININSWDEKDVYSVGDGRNDIEILEEYNGHRILISHPHILKIKNTTTSVHRLIKKLNSI